MRQLNFLAAVGMVYGLSVSAYANCPVYPNTALVIRAEIGDLQVDTTGREPVVDVRTQGVSVRENCTTKRAEYSGSAWGIWKIKVPRNIDLDLVAVGGAITVGDVDGDVFIRTSGGSVTVGTIRGDAAIATLGGAIKVGNIGGRAELRSPGTIQAGDIGGGASLHTTAGRIVVANVAGERIEAEAGRTITVSNARGVKASTTSGDILIGEATSVDAKSNAGNILTRRVRGPFQAHTERGDITIESAGSWVEASTKQGDIVVHMAPADMNGDLHLNLEAAAGNVTVFLPQRIRASAEMIVEHPIFRAAQIFSDFPMFPVRSLQGLGANNFNSAARAQSLINGGGNRILLHTWQGRISIRKN
jgi:DUF4097 and DUF4098 domain-containing protein YvlB